MRWCSIPFSFCKKSVFSILFLLSFVAGTICGNLMVRVAVLADPEWISRYSNELILSVPSSILLQILFCAIPFLAAVGIGALPFGSKLLLFLIGLRAYFLSYFLSVCYLTGIPVFLYLFRCICLLPLFYLLCQRIWLRSNWLHIS